MEKRPDFFEITSYEEFSQYYWYRQELSSLCRKLHIDDTGTKQDLELRIKEYFNGNFVIKPKSSQFTKCTKEITLDFPLLDCGFSFNATFREFFSKQTGKKNFKFTADMAAAWRKVKQEQDTAFTIQDMLNIYYHKSNYAKYDNSSCQWNQFLKDFCKDQRNAKFQNKLKAAAILWKIVRDYPLPKVYTYDLVEKHWNLLQQYSLRSNKPQ